MNLRKGYCYRIWEFVKVDIPTLPLCPSYTGDICKSGSTYYIHAPISTTPPTCTCLFGSKSLEPSLKKIRLSNALDIFEKHVDPFEFMVLHANSCTTKDCSIVDGILSFDCNYDVGVNAYFCAHETVDKLLPMLVLDITCLQMVLFFVHVEYVILNEFVAAHALNNFGAFHGRIDVYACFNSLVSKIIH